MKNHDDYDEIVKFIVVGDSNVGKTSIINQFCKQQFKPTQKSTVGLEYAHKIITINHRKILVQLWDTSGQQKFRSLTPSYYRSSMGVILVYSVDDRQSFNSITIWLKQIQSYVDQQIPIVIVGNKADVKTKQVTQLQSQSLTQLYKLDVFMVSCKQNKNIDEVIHYMYKRVKNRSLGDTRSKINVTVGNGVQNGRRCYC